MSDGRLIGDAYIAILPQTGQFYADAQTGIRRALGMIDARKAVGADTAPFLADFEAAKKAILAGGPIDVFIGANAASFQKTMAQMLAEAQVLRERLRNIPMTTDDRASIQAFRKADAMLGTLEKKLFTLRNIDIAKLAPEQYNAIAGELDDAVTKVDTLQHKLAHMDPHMDTTQAVERLANFRTMVAVLGDQLAAMKIDPNDLEGRLKVTEMMNRAHDLAIELEGMKADMNAGPMEAKILGLTIQAQKFQDALNGKTAKLGNLGMADAITQFEMADAELHKLQTDLGHVGGSKPAVQALSAAVGEMAARAATFRASGGIVTAGDLAHVEQLTQDLNTARTALNRITGAAGAAGGGGGFGIFGAIGNFIRNTHIPLFASQMTVAGKDAGLFARGLTVLGANALTTASGLHILIESVVEFGAVWGPAIVGMALFSYAATDTIKAIQTVANNSATVARANNVTFNGMVSGLNAVEKAAQPHVLMLWGDYLTAASKAGSHFSTVVDSIGTVLQGFGARILNAMSSNQGGKFLSKAAQDIQGLGDSFAQVGRIIGTFISVMPGYAQYLLNIGDAALKGAADLAQFAAPLLKVGLALHGGLFYFGLGATMLSTFGRSAYTAAKGLLTTGEAAQASGGKLSRWGTAVGNAIGGLAVAGRGLASYTKGLVAMGKDPNYGKMAALKTVIGDLGMAKWGPWALGITAVAVAIGLLAYAATHASNAAAQLNAQMEKQISSSNIAQVQGTIADSIKQTVALMKTQATVAQNVTSSYKTLGGSALLYSHTQAIAASQTDTNNSSLKQYYGQMGTSGARLAQLSTKYGSVTAAMQLMNMAGINQGDIASATAAQWKNDIAQMDVAASVYSFMGQKAGALGAQLSAMAISTGTTTQAVQALTSAESQWIAIATGGESAFTTFAQGFVTLSSQLGQVPQQVTKMIKSTGTLSTIYTTVTSSLNGLNSASLTARSTFTQQVAAAQTLYGNLQMLNAAAGATPKSVKTLQQSAQSIVGMFLNVAKTSPNATQQLYYLAQSMGYTGKATIAAMSQWAKYPASTKGATAATKALDGQQQQLTKDMGSLSQAAKNLGNALATNITDSQAKAILASAGFNNIQTQLWQTLQKTHNQVTPLAAALITQYYQAMVKATGSTDASTQSVNAFLQQLGLTPQQITKVDTMLGNLTGAAGTADGKIQSLTGDLSKLANTNWQVRIAFITSGSIPTGVYTGPAPVGPIGGGHPLAASGAYVVKGGGPSGKDSTPYMLAPGELVIPTSHAPKYLASAKRDGVPGLATGGMAGSSPFTSMMLSPAAAATTGPQMQPMTQYQGMMLIQLLQQLVKLGQQQPQALGQVLNNGTSQGARRAFFATGG